MCVCVCFTVRSYYTVTRLQAAAEKPKPIEKSTKRNISTKERPIRSATTDVVPKTKKVSKRRKVGATDINKEGPITKTKRKRLVSTDKVNEAIEQVETPKDPQVKKRKVKAKTEVQEKKVKKRKAVKKNIEKPTDEKLIDEKKLQDDLVKDFTNDE